MLPVSIQGLLRESVTFTWEDGHVTKLSARDLRLRCGCATCKDEWTGAPLLDTKKVPLTLRVQAMSVVGQYGLNVRFSDGHDTGIYRFADLRAGCPCDVCRPGKTDAPSR
jgi:ATP-binding protein involved in chromosome partitioning